MIRINVVRDGETIEHIFQGAEIAVGRSRDCDLVLRDEVSVSRRHCRIAIRGQRCEIRDLESRSGVVVNGRALSVGPVDVGDHIQLGKVGLEITGFGPDDPSPEAVKACLTCDAIMPVTAEECPECAGLAPRRKTSIISREKIPGYSLVRRLGAGGMGIVFEARRREDDCTVAIKILKPHLARNPLYLVRFVEETRVLTMLEHPNIVKIHGRGADKGLTWIDMELVQGDSARHLIRRRSRLDERQALRIAWETSLALDFAAGRRIIHGDVKPGNFLIDRNGTAKLCDFGLSRFMNFSRMDSPLFSPESSGRKGTAAYAAPERFGQGAKPTVPGDIYSMGVSLFHMITGELPFGGNKDARAVAGRSFVPEPERIVPNLRPATSMLLRRMMSEAPEDRYPSWRSFQEDLAVLLDR